MVLILFNFLLELISGDLLVLDNQVDLELLDTEANSNKLGSTPDETVLLNRTDVLLQLFKVGLVICKDNKLEHIRFKENPETLIRGLKTHPMA